MRWPPTTVFWDAPALPEGKHLTIHQVVLADLVPGRAPVARTLVGNTALDMAVPHSLVVPAGETHYYVIRYGDELVYDLAFGVGWNLVSLPIEPLNPAVDAVLDDGQRGTIHEGRVLSWSGAGYVETTEMHACVGYWVYATEANVLLVRGTPMVQEELVLREGWNLCGPTRLCPLPASSRARGNTWLWSPDTLRYQSTDFLWPGRGHWIRADVQTTVPLGDGR